MNGLEELLTECKKQNLAQGEFLGLLHIAIGRKVTRPDGTVVTAGVTWRELSRLLKKVRWPVESIQDLGMQEADFPPRDRERFWYMVLSKAGVDSESARQSADRLAKKLKPAGYILAPPLTKK
jgi:hypothetical protein